MHLTMWIKGVTRLRTLEHVCVCRGERDGGGLPLITTDSVKTYFFSSCSVKQWGGGGGGGGCVCVFFVLFFVFACGCKFQWTEQNDTTQFMWLSKVFQSFGKTLPFWRPEKMNNFTEIFESLWSLTVPVKNWKASDSMTCWVASYFGFYVNVHCRHEIPGLHSISYLYTHWHPICEVEGVQAWPTANQRPVDEYLSSLVFEFCEF